MSSSQTLVPTMNFAMVCPGIYRSGYPSKKNYPFLKALKLKSIIYLCPEEYAESNLKFCEQNNIHIFRFPTEGNKEPFTDIPESLMHRLLSVFVDVRNHPLLIHCNKGKHRTGTCVGCLRLLQGFSLVSIMQEYILFAGDKARLTDQQYIELYHPIVKVTMPYVAPWVCLSPRVRLVFSEEELQAEETKQLLCESLLAPTPYFTTAGQGETNYRQSNNNNTNYNNSSSVAGGEAPKVYTTTLLHTATTTTTSVNLVHYDSVPAGDGCLNAAALGDAVPSTSEHLADHPNPGGSSNNNINSNNNNNITATSAGVLPSPILGPASGPNISPGASIGGGNSSVPTTTTTTNTNNVNFADGGIALGRRAASATSPSPSVLANIHTATNNANRKEL